MNDVCNLTICIHIFFSFISFTLFKRVSIENRHEQCFENARFPKRKMVFLSSSNAIQHEKKRKPWKINSSWRDCLFSFLFEFLPHCVWLKMIMKCKLFEILTRHSFQKKRNTLYSFWKSFRQWTENADCLQGERDYFPSSLDLNWMFSIVSKWILILSNFRIINKK